MPLLVAPPTTCEVELHGLPPEALATCLKQEVSNWLKLYESNEEMKTMIQETQLGQEASEGVRLNKEDIDELQKACQENLDAIDRKGNLIAAMKEILVEKAGENAIPVEVIQAEAKLDAIIQDPNSQGIAL